MKLNLLTTLCGLLFLTLSLNSCQKEEILPGVKDQLRIEARAAGVNCSTGLTTTYPATAVCAGENFTLTTNGPCGRWKIQETTTGAACGSTTGWVDLNGDFTCAGVYSYTTPSPRAPGVYSFRTVHLQSKTGQCTNTACTTFTGEQYCCFTVTVAACCDISVGDYFTYSHGFYGNNNGEAFFLAHPELGPVTVGCGANTTAYTLEAINALMQGGNNAPPGILVKQIITMMLNVGASGFLASEQDLGCLVVVADGDPLTTLDDLFEGMTVDEVIAAANDYVGGCDTTTFTAGQLTAILEAMVNNFHLGNVNLGLLTCCEE